MSSYKFYINFIDENKAIEIAEPFQFASFSHGVERKAEGFSTDVRLFSENTELNFTNTLFESSEMRQDIDGTILFNLSHELKRLFDAYNEYGPDAQIELQIFYEGLLLTKCDFDLEDVKTDLVSYFQCGFIENNIRSKFKKREEDVTIDVYADKDLDGNAIQKLVPVRILLPSKPTSAKSKWIKTDIPYEGAPGNVTNKFPAGAGFRYFTFSRNPILYGIDDSVIPSPFDLSNSLADTYNGSMKFIDAKSTKTNLKFVITSNVSFVHKQNGRTGYANKSSLSLNLRFSSGITIGESTNYVLHSKEFTGTQTQSYAFPNVIEFDYPNILNEGEFVTLYWEYRWDEGTIALTADYNQIDNYSRVIFNDCEIEVSTIETSINSVILANRWIDVVKKSAEIICGLPVDAPKMDIGGEYYNIMCTNGGGIRNIENIPFNLEVKELFECGDMVALDYQVTENDIKFAEYKEFFSDRKLRSFKVKPSEEFTWNTNKEYRIKTFKYAFETYEQDREEQSTLDAVHTEIELLMPNVKPTGVKIIKLKQIMDDYKIDSLRRLGVNPDTKDSSLTNDTDLVFLDVVPLSNNHKETYTGLMNISAVSGFIKIFSEIYRWDKLGMVIGGEFEILTGSNAGVYTIANIETNLITLSPIGSIVNTSEGKIVTIRYKLSGVLYTARTSEGFADIQGLVSPNRTYNLMYTKTRNIQKWLPFLATCTMRYDSEIKVSFLKCNQDLSTRLDTELINIIEKDPIELKNIAHLKRVTDRVFNITVFPEDPSQIEQMFKELNTRNEDGTIGGYYEFTGIDGTVISGYPRKLEYIPSQNMLEAECVEKYVSTDFLLNTADKSSYSQYNSYGIYVNLYKADGSEIFRGKRFTKIIIDGIRYDNLALFLNNLHEYFA